MRIVTVQATIKDESLCQFLDASSTNGRTSVATEAGCQRFEVFHDAENPRRIGFTEIYDNDAAVVAHGETAHFGAWLAAVDGHDEGDMIFATCRGMTERKPPAGTAFAVDASGATGGRHILQGRITISAPTIQLRSQVRCWPKLARRCLTSQVACGSTWAKASTTRLSFGYLRSTPATMPMSTIVPPRIR